MLSHDNSCTKIHCSKNKDASGYCWYSETKSFMLLSASVNSISSLPSPVYRWRKAFRRSMAAKWSATRMNISWIDVDFPAKATAVLRPFGGISQTDVLILFGIHSTKYMRDFCSARSVPAHPLLLSACGHGKELQQWGSGRDVGLRPCWKRD